MKPREKDELLDILFDFYIPAYPESLKIEIGLRMVKEKGLEEDDEDLVQLGLQQLLKERREEIRRFFKKIDWKVRDVKTLFDLIFNK